jgi:hypothetical protein
VEWIHLAGGKIMWRALVATVIKFGVPKRQGIPRVTELLSASQEGYFKIQLLAT